MSIGLGNDTRIECVKSDQVFVRMPIRTAGYTEGLQDCLERSPLDIRDRDFILVNAGAVETAVKRASHPSATRATFIELCRKVEAFDKAIIKARPSAGEVYEELIKFLNYLPNKSLPSGWTIDGAPPAIEKAAKQGIPYAQFRLGEHLITKSMAQSDLFLDLYYRRHRSEAEQWLIKAASQGHVQSDYLLGVFCHGHNSSLKAVIPHRNSALAVFHMERAASKGHMAAQYNMGIFRKNGVGMAPDLNAAFQWFKLSALQGFPAAQNALGKCYLNGWGVMRDPDSAVKWFKLAALQGLADGMCNLGECLVKNHSSRSEGVKWLLKAAERHNIGAQVLIGESYLRGVGVERDVAKALGYLSYAAERKNPTACWLLGQCYQNGTGVEIDSSKAEDYSKRAVEGEEMMMAMRQRLPYLIVEDHWAK